MLYFSLFLFYLKLIWPFFSDLNKNDLREYLQRASALAVVLKLIKNFTQDE